ncbi:hypothetical protein PAEPH01_0400 [Pancytospora epiphaga]|nr:hypothetical protein PAEPH01_0400 [Pancytospora epiphaga]
MGITNEHIEMLRTIVKPEDLMSVRILSDSATPLRIHTGQTPSEASLLSNSDKIYFTRQRPVKKNKKIGMRNTDISNSAPGYFDDFGNFILRESDKIATLWLIRNEATSGSIEGPFTSEEIKRVSESGNLKGKWIRRSFDRGFVAADGLLAEHPGFYNSRNLNKYFAMNQVVEEEPLAEEAEDDFYSEVVTKASTTKLANFIKNNNISASVKQLVGAIKDLTKNEAIKTIRNITRLGVVENTMLVELLVENSNTQILSDVDKDGFMMNVSGNRNGRLYRK